jgi:3',5'-cyclic-AMP phosphodiesterase
MQTPVRTLVHISDTHILPSEDDRLQTVDTFDTLHAVLERVAESGVRPDAVIVSGDIANGGEPVSYQRIKAELDRWQVQLQTQLIVAMGNHDSRPAFREAMLGAEPSQDPVEYVTWIGGLRVIVLDSTVPGAPYGQVRPDQLLWLEAELQTPADEGTLLVLHHPPVPDPTRLAGLLTLHGSAELEDVLAGSDVVGILAGHAHHAISASFAGVLCYAAPATAYSVDPLLLEEGTLRGVHGGGFGLIRVFDRQAVALTIAMPSAGGETYRMQITNEVLARWSGSDEAERALPASA